MRPRSGRQKIQRGSTKASVWPGTRDKSAGGEIPSPRAKNLPCPLGEQIGGPRRSVSRVRSWVRSCDPFRAQVPCLPFGRLGGGREVNNGTAGQHTDPFRTNPLLSIRFEPLLVRTAQPIPYQGTGCFKQSTTVQKSRRSSFFVFARLPNLNEYVAPRFPLSHFSFTGGKDVPF